MAAPPRGGKAPWIAPSAGARHYPAPMRRAVQGVLLFLLGATLLWVLVRLFGEEQVRDELARADRRLLAWAAVVFFTQFLTMGLRWWATLRLMGHEASAISMLRGNALSNLVNFLAPGHFGEPLVAAWIQRSGRADGVPAFAALVGSKVLATILSFAVLLACIPLLLTRGTTTWLVQVGITAGAIVVASIVAISLALSPRVASWGAGLVGRWTAGGVGLLSADSAERAGRTAEALVLGVRDSLANLGTRPAALFASAGISALKIASQIGFVLLLYGAFGADLTVAGATFLVTVDVLQNAVSIWIPANLGVQEAILTAAAAGGLAVDGAVAASAAIAHKAILIVHVAMGGVLFVLLGPLDRSRPEGATPRSRPSSGPSDPGDAPP